MIEWMVITESCKSKIAFESTRKRILLFCGDSGCLGDESKTGAMGVHEIRLLIKSFGMASTLLYLAKYWSLPTVADIDSHPPQNPYPTVHNY